VPAADSTPRDRAIVPGLRNFPSMVPADWLTRPVMAGRGGEAGSVLFLVNGYE